MKDLQSSCFKIESRAVTSLVPESWCYLKKIQARLEPFMAMTTLLLKKQQYFIFALQGNLTTMEERMEAFSLGLNNNLAIKGAANEVEGKRRLVAVATV